MKEDGDRGLCTSAPLETLGLWELQATAAWCRAAGGRE
jgi:hypothetical protein